jgi:hypothetical protein
MPYLGFTGRRVDFLELKQLRLHGAAACRIDAPAQFKVSRIATSRIIAFALTGGSAPPLSGR